MVEIEPAHEGKDPVEECVQPLRLEDGAVGELVAGVVGERIHGSEGEEGHGKADPDVTQEQDVGECTQRRDEQQVTEGLKKTPRVAAARVLAQNGRIDGTAIPGRVEAFADLTQ